MAAGLGKDKEKAALRDGFAGESPPYAYGCETPPSWTVRLEERF
ncbi:hypothetical protein WCP94_001521 [Bilophila wadsworthia]